MNHEPDEFKAAIDEAEKGLDEMDRMMERLQEIAHEYHEALISGGREAAREVVTRALQKAKEKSIDSE